MISFFRNSDKLFFIVEHKNEFSESEVDRLEWLFSGSKLLKEKKLKGKFIGPRIEMTTPWSTNAVEITKNIGINSISRIEILKLGYDNYDSMTEFSYKNPDENIFHLKNCRSCF